MKTNNILFISDLHAPYQHPDALLFLAALKDKYDFKRVICVGDELDFHAMSFHDHDPDLKNAGEELQSGREVLHELWKLFPFMDLVHSNHGSMHYRKAKHHGIPNHIILDYKDVVFGERNKDGTVYRPNLRGSGWNWSRELSFTLPDGNRCKVSHGMSVSTRRNIEQSGMCFVQGHHHGIFEMVYHGDSDRFLWGMTIGCLINDESIAFAYNKNTIKRPIIGCGAYIDGRPMLIPMMMTKGGRWTGTI